MTSETTIKNAFAAWLLDAPPIAHPCPAPIHSAAIRFGLIGEWPTVSENGAAHAVAGVFPSGWISVAGLGWRLFQGSAADFSAIISACTAAQVEALSDRSWFQSALSHYARRPAPAEIGGLPVIETTDDRDWVDLDPITCPDVKMTFQRQLKARSGAGMHRVQCNLGPYELDHTFADADAWWRFARQWAGQPEPSDC